MSGLVRTLFSVGAVGVVLLAANTAGAKSFGFMKLPSTAGQYLGCGYGAGHHAPLVHTPAQHPERIRRMTFLPSCYGQLGPAGYYQPMGCYGSSCYPAPTGPTLAPAPAIQPAPAVQGPMFYPPTAVRPAPGYAVR